MSIALAKRAFAGNRQDWPAPTVVAARQEPELNRVMLALWAASQASVDAHRLAASASSGDVAGALQALRPAHLASALGQAVRPRLATAVLSGAELAAEGLGHMGIPRKAPSLHVDLAGVNPAAVEWARAHAAELVVADAAIQAQIRALVVASQANKIPVLTLARQIRDLIGLDARRMTALARYESGLITDGIKSEMLAKRVARRADALRRDRALTIARTETIGALSAGQQALWDQAVARGLLDRARFGKTWIITDDEALCDECEALDGEVVGLDEEFSEGVDGPPLHPNCRCATGLAPLENE